MGRVGSKRGRDLRDRTTWLITALVFCNRQLCTIWNSSEISSSVGLVVFHITRNALIPHHLAHSLKNGKTVIAEAIRDMTTTLTGGAPYIGSTNDITLQVEGESAIQRLSDQRVAEAEQRRKDAIHQKEQQALLVDCVSHELRNGINPILQSSLLIRHSLMLTEGSFSLALRNSGGTMTITEENLRAIEEDIEACDAIIDSAHQMERVANDILGLAQIQLNQLDVTPVPFDLGSQLR